MTGLAATIAAEVDHFAFYVDHVVDRLTMRVGDQSPEDVREVVAHFLVDAQDPWNMSHFFERLESYYGANASLAARVLDAVALTEAPVKSAHIFETLKAQENVALEDVRSLLKLLAQDYYLQVNTSKHYSFRYGLIRRWWRIERELESGDE